MNKRRLANFALALLTLAATILPTISIYALDYDTLKFFADNNILYYDPSLRRKCSSAIDCNIAGETRDEKLWSGLRNLGLTPEQTAALMGNILHEGGTPARQEGSYNAARNQNCLTQNGTPYTIWDDKTNGQVHGTCMQEITRRADGTSVYSAGTGVAGIGLGFIQWTSHGRRLGYLQLMQDAGLIKYFDGDAYKTYGRYTDNELKQAIIEETGSEADYWALWCTALKYIYYELSSIKDYIGFFELDNLDDMAGFIASKYERCSSCSVGADGYKDRIATANEIYSRYQNGEFSAVEGGTATAHNYGTTTLTDGSKVTIIGDSITNGSRNKILSLLPQADIIAADSKQFAGTDASNPTGQQIVTSMVANNTLRSTVVIALGTNNTGLSTGQVDAMVAAVGEGRNIIFVNNYDDVDTEKYKNNNDQFNAAAVKYDNVSVADWKGAIQSAKAANPSTSYIKHEASYAVHPEDAGKELFAKTIVDAINGTTKSLNTCATDLIADPSQAVSYLQQFIIDTNHRYGFNYALPPADAPINVALDTPADDTNTHTDGGCWGATFCGQCTALSGWFIQMMTNLVFNGTGNGDQTVGKTAAANAGSSAILHSTNGEFPTGVAIFSMTGGPYGHTGVVLGKNESGDFITIENNQCVAPCRADSDHHRLEIMTRSEETFRSRSTTFYPVDVVKVEHLGTTY